MLMDIILLKFTVYIHTNVYKHFTQVPRIQSFRDECVIVKGELNARVLMFMLGTTHAHKYRYHTSFEMFLLSAHRGFASYAFDKTVYEHISDEDILRQQYHILYSAEVFG